MFADDYEKVVTKKSYMDKKGYVIFSEHYEIEGPFLKGWILRWI